MSEKSILFCPFSFPFFLLFPAGDVCGPDLDRSDPIPVLLPCPSYVASPGLESSNTHLSNENSPFFGAPFYPAPQLRASIFTV